MALTAGRQVFGDGPVEVVGLSVDRALSVPVDDPTLDLRLHSVLTADGAFTVASRPGSRGDWTEHARGRVQRLLREQPPPRDAEEIRSGLSGTLSDDEHYRLCARAGLPYGSAFRVLTGLRVGEDEVLAEYAATVETDARYTAHPTVLDGALQAVAPLLSAVGDRPVAYLPTGVGTVRCWRLAADRGLIHLRLREISEQEVRWDVTVSTADGEVALELLDCRARRFDAALPPEPVALVEVLRAAPLPGAQDSSSRLPGPVDVLAACREEVAELMARWQAIPCQDLHARILEIAAHFTSAAVREFLPGVSSFTVDDLIVAGVSPAHRRLLESLLRLSARRGVLEEDQGDRWRAATAPVPEELVASGLRDFPGESVSFHIYGVCGRNLPAVLRGETDPLDLLLSEPDALAARFYDSMTLTRMAHQLARLVLRALVARWPADRPLRVLEVGAGTSGTTAALLPELPPERTHYVFTDLSSSFFPQARARLEAYDFVDYQSLDLDADPDGQGFAPGSFDLVIAGNVLHAVRDLKTALGRVAHLLADGGHLLTTELHNHDLLVPVFGLLDSYWAVTDTESRPQGPLLPCETWPQVLEDCGFTGVTQIGAAAESFRGDASVLLAARGPHTTRVPHALPTGATARRWAVTCLDDHGTGLLQAVTDALRAHHLPHTPSTVMAPDDPARWVELLAGTDAPAGIVLLAAEGRAASPSQTTEQAVRCLAVLRALASACEQTPAALKVAVWLVTFAADGGGTDCPPSTAGAGAAAWGAARTLANEQPGIAIRRIALSDAGQGADSLAPLAGRLVTEMLSPTDEDEVLLTPGGRFVTRVLPLPPPRQPSLGAAMTPFTLALHQPGQHYRLEWKPAAVPVPGSGEVVVEVAAAGLNYRDVAVATGLVPSLPLDRRLDAAPLGMAAGRRSPPWASATSRPAKHSPPWNNCWHTRTPPLSRSVAST